MYNIWLMPLLISLSSDLRAPEHPVVYLFSIWLSQLYPLEFNKRQVFVHTSISISIQLIIIRPNPLSSFFSSVSCQASSWQAICFYIPALFHFREAVTATNFPIKSCTDCIQNIRDVRFKKRKSIRDVDLSRSWTTVTSSSSSSSSSNVNGSRLVDTRGRAREVTCQTTNGG